MPELSRFFGIVITMNYADHAPPHFHVRYGSQKALVGLDSLSVLAGMLSPRTLALVVEWAAIHRSELWANWTLAERKAELQPIPPLE